MLMVFIAEKTENQMLAIIKDRDATIRSLI